MTIHQPVLMQPAAGDSTIFYTQQDFRNYNRALMGLASGFEGAEGIVGNLGVTSAGSTAMTGPFAVTQHAAGANFSVDIAAGKCFIRDDDITNGGTYMVWNDSTFNLTGIPSPPASGTRHHRIVLQMQNKSENGSWSGYTMAPTVVADTGGGLPAEPASALTIAQVDVTVGQASVTNSNITDWRQTVNSVYVTKNGDTARASQTSVADDPDLQLSGMAQNAQYLLQGQLFYTGGTGVSEGDLQWTWRQAGGGQLIRYNAIRVNASGNFTGGFQFVGGDSVAAQTTGTSQVMVATIQGLIVTVAAQPAWAVLQWAQNTSTTTNTTMKQYSWLGATRVG